MMDGFHGWAAMLARRYAWLLLSVAALASYTSSAEAKLRYMFAIGKGVEPSVQGVPAKRFSCPSPVRPMTDMSRLFAFYKPEKTRSQIDRHAMTAYSKRVWPTQAVTKKLTSMMEAAIAEPWNRELIAHCMVRQLQAWADANALLGKLADNTPAGHRQAILIGIWNSIAFANAYAIASQAGSVSASARASIDAWFARLSEEIVAEFTPPTHPRQKEDRWLDGNSNHRYWAGAAVGLMAAHLQDRARFDWSMSILRSALAEAEDDGRLLRELGRGGRSLHYQNFALFPLALLSVLADRNGVVLSPAEERKLAAIARFSAKSFADPRGLEALVGHEQERNPGMVIWIDVLLPRLAHREPEFAKQLNAIAEPHRPFSSAFVGLPATQLFQGTRANQP